MGWSSGPPYWLFWALYSTGSMSAWLLSTGTCRQASAISPTGWKSAYLFLSLRWDLSFSSLLWPECLFCMNILNTQMHTKKKETSAYGPSILYTAWFFLAHGEYHLSANHTRIIGNHAILAYSCRKGRGIAIPLLRYKPHAKNSSPKYPFWYHPRAVMVPHMLPEMIKW